MPLVNTKQMFAHAYEHGYAIGCFNVDSIAMVQAVLLAAERTRSPVMVAFSKGSREFVHPGNIKQLIEIVAKDITIPYAIHLDHGKSIELCKACIDEGFTSVMIDTGDASFEESVAITKEVCAYAHARGVCVEGEIGSFNPETSYTDPVLAARFVALTGVDSLAVSIGTGHGTHKFKSNDIPSLRLDILNEIKTLLPNFPLVLHGSSSIPAAIVSDFNRYGGTIDDPIGIPESLLIKAASINVCKINIGTDFRMAYVAGLRKSLHEHSNRYEPRFFLEPAKTAATKLVEYKLINVFKSANRV